MTNFINTIFTSIATIAAAGAHALAPTQQPAMATQTAIPAQPTARLLKAGVKVGDTLIPAVYQDSRRGPRIILKREKDYDLANEILPAAGLLPGRSLDEFTIDADSPLMTAFSKQVAATVATQAKRAAAKQARAEARASI